MTEMDEDVGGRHDWRGTSVAVFRMNSCGINRLRKYVGGPEYFTRLGINRDSVKLIARLCRLGVFSDSVRYVQDIIAKNRR